jgi:hypothetical protein
MSEKENRLFFTLQLPFVFSALSVSLWFNSSLRAFVDLCVFVVLLLRDSFRPRWRFALGFAAPTTFSIRPTIREMPT